MHRTGKPTTESRKPAGAEAPSHGESHPGVSPGAEERALAAITSLIESIDVSADTSETIPRMLERASRLLEADRASVLLDLGGPEHSTRLLAAQGRGADTVIRP